MSDISISDEDEYDFSSEPESDMDMEIEPITSQNSSHSSQHYELIKREKVFELMNSLLAELEKITQISSVRSFHFFMIISLRFASLLIKASICYPWFVDSAACAAQHIQVGQGPSA